MLSHILNLPYANPFPIRQPPILRRTRPLLLCPTPQRQLPRPLRNPHRVLHGRHRDFLSVDTTLVFTQWRTNGAVWFDGGGYWEGAKCFTGGDAASKDIGVSACCVDDVFVGLRKGER